MRASEPVQASSSKFGSKVARQHNARRRFKKGATMIIRKLSAGLFLLCFASAISPASAHPHLKAAGPAPGSVVKTSPKALRIQFSEGIVLAFSGVEITDAHGQKLPIAKATLSPKDNKQLVVPLAANLAPGKYNVA